MKKRFFVFLLALSLIMTSFGSNLMIYAVEGNTITTYHESFSTDQGVATQSGGANLAVVADKTFDGNDDGKALYVSNRTNDYDAVDFSFADMGLEDGKTYTATVTVYVDSDESIPSGSQIVLSLIDSYTWLANVDATAGAAITLTNSFTVDTLSNTKLRVQSNASGATVPFYVGEVLITEENDEVINIETVYNESFTDDQGVATQSGGVNLAVVADKTFDGNDDGKALYVSNRANDYDAVDFSFADTGLEDGKTYTATVTVYVDAEESIPSGSQIVLSLIDSYTWLANVDATAGTAITLTNSFTVDTLSNTKLRVQSNADGATVPFYVGEVLITEETTNDGDPTDENDNEDEVPRDPALPFTTITFEDQNLAGFEGRGGNEVLTITDEVNNTDAGSYALKVEGREQAWNGPMLRVEQYIDKGYEYKITAWVKLISPSTSQLQLSTQVGNGDGASYNNLEGKTVSADDGWVKFEGTYRYSSVGDEYVTIYVESSNNAEASYYIDDISFEPTGSGTVDIQTDLTPLKEVYEDYFLIGNIVSARDFEGNRLELLTMHHNVVTAENAMKPVYAYGTYPEFDLTAEDLLVAQSAEAGLDMVGHVLVWHQQSEELLHTDADGNPLSREVALSNLRNHVTTVVEHFGDQVISWDVVNEAMNDNPANPSDWRASLRQSGWLEAIGTDYVKEAFIAAREALNGKDVKLYYNDYNDDNQNKAEAIYQMVKEINEEYADAHNGELLIDGIGMQAHYNLHTNPENVRKSLEKFISVTNEVSITELDITAGSNNVLTDKQANEQAYLYARLFVLYKEHADHIARVTFWGLDDATSWRAAQCPLLFDGNLQAKPAYYAVINPENFIASYDPEEKESKQGTALFGTPTIDGTVDAIWNDATPLSVNQYQMAWQGATGIAKVLWDNENLYVLINVSDSQLDKSSSNPWEQDSIEIFVDQNNAKSSSYEADDGQYRINFDNETSFNPGSIAEGFESATIVNGSNYIAEVKIPLNAITPAEGTEIGFDIQINDGNDGSRQSVAAWNDTTGTGYQDTSVYGVITLTTETEDVVEDSPISNNPNTSNTDTPDPNTSKVDVTSRTIDDLIEESVGTNEVIIKVDIPKDKPADITIPLKAIKASTVNNITVDTTEVSVSINKDNLADDAESMNLTIGTVSTKDLPENIIEMIGENPVYDFNLTVDGKRVSEFNSPVKVSIKYNLPEGKDPNTVIIYYLNDNNELEIIRNGAYDPETGLVTFSTDHFSKYFAVIRNVRLTDIENTFWAKDAINYVVARDIMKANDTFNPSNTITRGELIEIIVNTYELESRDAKARFIDVDQSNEYYNSIAIAQQLGIISGYPDSTFRPDLEVSREEFAQIVYNVFKLNNLLTGTEQLTEDFSDVTAINSFAQEAIAELRKYGYIKGYGDNKFKPFNKVTKAELASFFTR